jgi:GDPmannose 4,6-dehydratase
MFYPKSPYGVSKLFGYWMTRVYRESYNLHASNGILFNHESPLRGETFVTKKIAMSAAKNFLGEENILQLGNLYSTRDWGHAADYVESMWKILQKPKADDYVISTNIGYTVKEFVNECYNVVGIKVSWKGKGINEIGYNKKTNKILVEINSKYFRPNEVENLRGDSSKARKVLDWKPRSDFKSLAKEMMAYEIKRIQDK